MSDQHSIDDLYTAPARAQPYPGTSSAAPVRAAGIAARTRPEPAAPRAARKRGLLCRRCATSCATPQDAGRWRWSLSITTGWPEIGVRAHHDGGMRRSSEPRPQRHL